MQRPGIYYSQEIEYPPLRAELKPAVPAIFGYTEKAEDAEGNSLHLKPHRLDSIEAYHQHFGKGYCPEFMALVNASGAVVQLIPGRRFYLYDSLRLFFENGGREIYIVSIGTYRQKNLTPTADLPEFKAGINALKYFDEPDLLLFPDAVEMNHSELGQIQNFCLNHCREEKFQFAIFDLKPAGAPIPTIDTFRKYIEQENRDRGAAYHPWIHTDLEMEVSPKKIKFSPDQYVISPVQANPVQGVPVKNEPVKNVPVKNVPVKNEPVKGVQTALPTKGLQPKEPQPREVQPRDIPTRDIPTNIPLRIQAATPKNTSEDAHADSRVGIPERKALPRDWQEIMAGLIEIGPEQYLGKKTFAQLSDHFERIRNQLRNDSLKNLEENIRSFMAFGRSLVMAYGKLERYDDLPDAARERLQKLKANPEIGRAMGMVLAYEQHRTLQSMQGLNPRQLPLWYGGMVGPKAWIPAWPKASSKKFPFYLLSEKQLADAPKMVGGILLGNAIAAGWSMAKEPAYLDAAKVLINNYQQLFNALGKGKQPWLEYNPSPEQVVEATQMALNILQYLPPSGAVAGLVASTDRSRGTFKAPANKQLVRVLAPGDLLNHQEQSYYNVHHTGKSVNPLIPVVGSGTVVHGARTLKSNDPEWRYVPVRRYFLAIEKTLQEALAQYVFEPNNASTWDLIRGQLGLMLEKQRERGALQGDTADEAWQLGIGLGESMNQDDVLQGKLIVRIGLAVVRPAEFILLTLVQHQENN